MSQSADNDLPDDSKLVLGHDQVVPLLVGLAILVLVIVLYLLTDAFIAWRRTRRDMKSRKRHLK